MQKELTVWRDENTQHEKALKAEQRYRAYLLGQDLIRLDKSQNLLAY